MTERMIVPGRRLGRLRPPAVKRDRALKMANYVTGALPPPPPTLDLTAGITAWPMYANDRLGDCLVEGTLVGATGIQQGYRALYEGPIVRLVFASGKRLSVTPNHAVLTPAGFRRASTLNEGDYAIGTRRPKPVRPAGQLHFDQAPAPIEQIVAALSGGRSTSRQIPKTLMHRAIDFHGDERFVDGDVDVVRPDRLLEREVFNVALGEPDRQREVRSASELKRPFHGEGASGQGDRVGRPASLGPMRRFGQRGALLATHAGIAQAHGLSDGSRLMPSLSQQGDEAARRNSEFASKSPGGLAPLVSLEGDSKIGVGAPVAQRLRFTIGAGPVASNVHPSNDGGPTDPHLASDLLKRHPGLIEADRVVEVKTDWYRGHVYDLSTESRFYEAEGIVTHNCTCAAAAHMVEIWSKQVTGTAQVFTDDQVIALYETQGYNPAVPGSDQGANEMSVLDTMRSTGLDGFTLYAYASVDTSNRTLLQTSAWLFSGLYLGVGLPITAQSQAVWDVVPADPGQNAPGTWGGHAVNVVGYDAEGLTIITWGATKRMTWAFFDTYCDEAWCCIPTDYQALGTAPLPSGFNFQQLEADLLQVGQVN